MWLRASSSRSQRVTPGGFTTVELIVALVIVVVMSTVVVVSMGSALGEARLRSGCRMVVAALNYARSYAASRQTYTRADFGTDGTSVTVLARMQAAENEMALLRLTTPSGRQRVLPDGVRVVRVAKAATEEEENYIGFSQLGQADESMILVEDARGKRRTIAVEAITGRCTVSDGEVWREQ